MKTKGRSACRCKQQVFLWHESICTIDVHYCRSILNKKTSKPRQQSGRSSASGSAKQHYLTKARYLPGEYTFEQLQEKTRLRGFLPGSTQTGLCSHRRWLEIEILDKGSRGIVPCYVMMYVAITKEHSCTVFVKLGIG